MASEQTGSTPSSRSSSRSRSDRGEPTRRSSTWSNTLDPNNGAVSAGQPSLFRILNAAAQYGQLALTEDEPDSDEGATPATEAAADTHISPDVGGNLEQKDFLAPETALANIGLYSASINSRAGSTASLRRFVQYAASGNMTPEMRAMEIEETATDKPRPMCDPSKALDHEVALKILQHEFGELTLPGEVEEMILETDAALFRDIAIIGVVHLTTHRITFHASLLPDDTPTPTGPELTTSHQSADGRIIKAGPGDVIEPRAGILHPAKKRRVWVELSHDMITTYPDASDEGRVKPIRSVLLSHVNDVEPHDPTHPRRVRIQISILDQKFTVDAEYDTEESANEWRRETQAALYMYRYRRKTLLGQAGEKGAARKPEDAQTKSRGIRICIPLAQIQEYQHEWWAGFAFILSIAVEHALPISVGARSSGNHSGATKDLLGAALPSIENASQTPKPKRRESCRKIFRSQRTSQAPSVSPTTTVLTDGSSLSSASTGISSVPPPPSPGLQTTPASSESEGLANTLHLSIMQGDTKWEAFDDLVKVRRQSGGPPNVQAVLDWGELVFDEHPGSEESDENKEVKVEAPLDTEISSAERKIRRLFAIDDQQAVWIARCRLCGPVSSTTYFVISDRFVCYWAKSFYVRDTRYRFPISAIRGAAPTYVYAPRVHGLRVQIRGQQDLTFEFSSRELRDDALGRLKAIADTNLANGDNSTNTLNSPSQAPSPRSEQPRPVAAPDHGTLENCMSDVPALLSPISRVMERVNQVYIPPELISRFPKPINVPPSAQAHIPSKHFVCLTIGSRGDVQPYIALARGLIAEGHRATIVTHGEYKEWCEGWGVPHRTAGGDPTALMKLSVEYRMFSPQFFKEGLSHFRDWLDDLLLDAWNQCQDADVLIQSPSAMAGAHIAEALKIPFFHAFTMPWTRTNDYPHAFMTPPVEISGSFNYSTYVVFDNVFWQATSGQINRWRRKHLGLPNTDMAHLAQTKIPFIYNFSPAVVPKPLDWKDPIVISGYWFLDNPDLNWKPSQELTDFMNKARADGKPLVYIGFGSIVVPNPRAMTRSIVKAVLKSDVRAILSKGWSERLSKDAGPEIELPPEVFSIDKIPHDWLFPKIDAALHHGGAGTTGASLRAGIPTLIKPWFGDQFFWATRVTKLGAGLRVTSLSSSDLSDALKRAVSDRVMKEKAAAVGERIRSENGVDNAIRSIYLYLHRAGLDRTTL